MKKIFLSLMCAGLMLGSSVAFAQHDGDWRGGIRARIGEAQERIERGVDRGSLTREESRRLRRELGFILRRIDRMREDGHLSPRERDQINDDLDRLDRDISREKHDGDERGERRHHHRD